MRTCFLLLAALVLAGCGSAEKAAPKAAPKPTTFTVQGELDLSGSGTGVLADDGRKGSHCIGQNGYDDITEGAQVVVRNDAGKAVGLGQLDAGQMLGSIDDDADCRFSFIVSDVPAKSSIYSIEVSHRGQTQFKRDNAEGLVLTLG